VASTPAEAVATPRATWRHYYELTKPKVVLLIVFTSIVGTLLATPGLPPLDALLWGNLGIGLAASCAAAINHVLDQKIDEKMARTRHRPLPTGSVNNAQALSFAAVLGLASMAMLWLLVNPLTAVLTFLSLIGYAVIYTVWLKRATSQNIVIGGAAGAFPPMVGWAAVTGDVSWAAVVMFAIIFMWTPPHFWALSLRLKDDYADAGVPMLPVTAGVRHTRIQIVLYSIALIPVTLPIARRDEYARAGIPMLPVTHGIPYTRLQVLLYTVLLVLVTFMPFLTGMSGLIYLATTLVLNGIFLYYSFAMKFTGRGELPMKVFKVSVQYLMYLFAALLVDHYVPTTQLLVPVGP
jgi:protoheme IX farnesyltransferase